jgi:hypothetical protein
MNAAACPAKVIWPGFVHPLEKRSTVVAASRARQRVL